MCKKDSSVCLKRIIACVILAVFAAFIYSTPVLGKTRTIKYSKQVVYQGNGDKKTPMGSGVLFISSSPTFLKDGLSSAPFDKIEGDFENLRIYDGTLTFPNGNYITGDIDVTISETEVTYVISNASLHRLIKKDIKRISDGSYTYYDVLEKTTYTTFGGAPTKIEIEYPITESVTITRKIANNNFSLIPTSIEYLYTEIIKRPYMPNIGSVENKMYATSFSFAGGSVQELKSTFLTNISLPEMEISRSSNNNKSVWDFQNGCKGYFEQKGDSLIVILNNGDDYFERRCINDDEAILRVIKHLGDNECILTYNGPDYTYERRYSQYDYLAIYLKDYMSLNSLDRIKKAQKWVEDNQLNHSSDTRIKVTNYSHFSKYLTLKYKDGSSYIGDTNYGILQLLELSEIPQMNNYTCGVYHNSKGEETIIVNDELTLTKLEDKIDQYEFASRQEELEREKEKKETEQWEESMRKKYGKQYFEALYYYQRIEVGMPEDMLLELLRNMKLWEEDSYYKIYRIYNDWGNNWMKTIWIDKKTKKITQVINHD